MIAQAGDFSNCGENNSKLAKVTSTIPEKIFIKLRERVNSLNKRIIALPDHEMIKALLSN